MEAIYRSSQEGFGTFPTQIHFQLQPCGLVWYATKSKVIPVFWKTYFGRLQRGEIMPKKKSKASEEEGVKQELGQGPSSKTTDNHQNSSTRTFYLCECPECWSCPDRRGEEIYLYIAVETPPPPMYLWDPMDPMTPLVHLPLTIGADLGR